MLLIAIKKKILGIKNPKFFRSNVSSFVELIVIRVFIFSICKSLRTWFLIIFQTFNTKLAYSDVIKINISRKFSHRLGSNFHRSYWAMDVRRGTQKKNCGAARHHLWVLGFWPLLSPSWTYVRRCVAGSSAPWWTGCGRQHGRAAQLASPLRSAS